ncbi:hypothetical protein REPUB_Repub16aG0007800 [Reevesia pubescens]
MAGCGGVLTNSSGTVCGMFYGPINCIGASTSEHFAIKIGLELFCSSPWLKI